MQCANCGAQIQKGDKRCAYCGADIFAEALKEHQSEVDDLNRKAYWWTKLPEKLARKGSRVAVIVIICVILLGLAGALVARIAGPIRASKNYDAKQEMLAQFETLYEAGEFEKIAQLYENYDGYKGESFERYGKIHYLNMYLGFATRDMQTWIASAKQFQNPSYLSQFQYFFQVLKICDEYEADGYLYDEEVAVTYYRDTVYAYLYDEFHFTQEEVREIYENYLQRVKNGEDLNSIGEYIGQLVLDKVQ